MCLQSNPSGSFLQKSINFVEQRLKFYHFEGSIIPQSYPFICIGFLLVCLYFSILAKLGVNF